MNELYIDKLTGLNNKAYLEKNYHSFIKEHPNCKYIMIDFTKFKKINDTYGHDAGDACLRTFGKKLRIYFRESMTVRLHGDEFVIISYSDDERIENLFNLINMSLDADLRSGAIPVKFRFNAGYSFCSDSLEETADRADCMMYYAKQNKKCFIPYDEKVYEEKVEGERINEDFNRQLKHEDFSYYGRRVYKDANKPSPYLQIYTKNQNGDSFLNRKLYRVIRNNQVISKFDLYNMQKLIEIASMTYSRDKYFINIDYRSLFSFRELIEFLDIMKETSINKLKNVVLSIDVTGIETSEYDFVLDIIEIMKEYGFEISLNKVDGKIAPYFLASTKPDFIKLVAGLWKSAQTDSRKQELLRKAIDFMSICGDNSILLFDRIENEQENNYVDSISAGRTYKSGDYFSKEKRLQLK